MHERSDAPLLLKLMMAHHVLFLYAVAASSAAVALGSEVVNWGEAWSDGLPASSAATAATAAASDASASAAAASASSVGAPGDVGVGSLVPTAPVSYTPSFQLSHTGLSHVYLASMLVAGGLAVAGPPICCWMA